MKTGKVSHKEIVLGALLDNEGASDNTSFNAIITAARQRGLEETCCRWVGSMLESRLVHTSLMGSNLAAQAVVGCPQGAVCPLWNSVVDKLLVEASGLGFNILGYADDIVIIVHGKFAHTVGALMRSAVNVVVKWAVRGYKNYPHKAAIVPFTNRRNVEGLGPLILDGKELKMLGGG
jgi:hypothetical protein